jgi:ribosomal protein S18 acetylase RimI-like enzyme
MTPVVRRIAADEVDLARDIRLRALRDAPLAFGSTYEREIAFERAEWERRVAENAAGERSVAFIVEPRDGLAVGALDAADATVAHLYAMWVAPEARGAGAARALVDAVVAWARERGARLIETTVAEGNVAASALYERSGFVDTGRREPLGHSDGVVAVLERSLG